MLVRFEKIDDLSNGVVQFYTVRLGNNLLSEFELFDEKEFPNHENEVILTYNVIMEMGKRGAQKIYFKHEHAANALPRVSQEIMEANKDDFGLRLYCIHLTRTLVVLLNGDIKTAINPENCKNVKAHFLQAKKIAVHLDKALANGEISYLTEDSLTDFEIEI